MDQNGTTDDKDVDYLINVTMDTEYGDVNLDGVFNSKDLVLVFQAGFYEHDLRGFVLDYENGDWNGDGRFDSSDLVFVFEKGGYSQSAHSNPGEAVASFEGSLSQTGPNALRTFSKVGLKSAR